jgi:two-component system response regulator FixJ
MHQEQTTNMPLHFVESDTQTRAEIVRVGMSLGHHCELYSDLSELAAHPPRSGVIVVRDCPEHGGIDLIMNRLMTLGISLPVVAMDENPSATRVVDAVKAGALDYLALPLKPERLSNCLSRISREAPMVCEVRKRAIEARQRLSALSGREREVLDHLVNGGSNKEIARQLEISPRTVEIHRANMMSKLGARHSAEAIRLKMESTIGAAMILS